MLELVKVDYQGQPLSFSEDGWFNATVAAERFGKRPVDWLRLDETKEYITVLRSFLNEGQESHFKCEPESHLNTSKVRDLVRTRRGKSAGEAGKPQYRAHRVRSLIPGAQGRA